MGPKRWSKLRRALALAIVLCVAAQPALAALLNLAQTPLFIGANIPPQVMLTISKDQQLFKKAYNDYSDLDGDGQIETTYKHTIDYYGYFDPTKCYNYSTANQRFEPASVSRRQVLRRQLERQLPQLGLDVAHGRGAQAPLRRHALDRQTSHGGVTVRSSAPTCRRTRTPGRSTTTAPTSRS